MTESDETITVMDIVSTKKAIATNVMTTASINCHGMKVRDFYILHTLLLAIIITIDNYYYLLLLCKTKRYYEKIENNKLKKVRIKNRTCYYFDDIIKLEDFNLDNILIDEKSHENILIYDISYKTLIGSKPLRIRFNKINGITRIYDGSRYLSLPGTENYDVIYDRIRYLISLKSSITYIFSHYFAKIKVDSYDSLPIEKTLTLYYVIILIKSVLNKDKNHYYCKTILEKCLYQLAKK